MRSDGTPTMRILFCSADRYPPFRVDVTVLFAKELRKRGMSIDWILQSEEDCKKPYVASWEGGQVWVGAADNGTTRLRRVRKHISSIWHDLKMFGLARENRYDLIQVKDKFVSALFGILAARLNGAKFTYWLSYPFPEASLYEAREGTARYSLFYYLRGHVFKFMLYKLIAPLSEHLFVQSEQMKRDIIEMGVPGEKMTAVPMGVSLDKFEVTADGPGSQPDAGKHAIVYLGTMHRVRRIDFLLRVLKIIRQTLPNVVLYMVGGAENPEDEEELKREADRLQIGDSVVFTGNLPQAEALGFVRRADLCLSPFYPTPILNSTSPTKLIEYMAMAKAVVANDHPEQKLVIAESGAGRCVAYDETEFATAVVELLGKPELLVEMGNKGREYVENRRTYSKIADRVFQVYRRILSGSEEVV